jgi:hypothetical protein
MNFTKVIALFRAAALGLRAGPTRGKENDLLFQAYPPLTRWAKLCRPRLGAAAMYIRGVCSPHERPTHSHVRKRSERHWQL